ncbi:MAG: hypothetical protein RMK29_22240 [Myxococcales bacterium]|nr:hypothetical protein [Myxococcota bacterium]MDW8284436.1 hypothetical protein [Myxococcales bacterium]
MVALSPLRCLAPRCPRQRPLYLSPAGLLVCPSCGVVRAPREHFRLYGARTAQWIVGGAVWLSLGYGRQGPLRLVLLTLGTLCLLYALGRVVCQALALRDLRHKP